MSFYCGNNALDSRLISGDKILGTRYDCLRSGYGRGMHEPVDLRFIQEYSPIDPRKYYCGNSNELPNNYHDFGSLHGCFLKGFGIAKKNKAEKESKIVRKGTLTEKKRKNKFYLICIAFISI